MSSQRTLWEGGGGPGSDRGLGRRQSGREKPAAQDEVGPQSTAPQGVGRAGSGPYPALLEGASSRELLNMRQHQCVV